MNKTTVGTAHELANYYAKETWKDYEIYSAIKDTSLEYQIRPITNLFHKHKALYLVYKYIAEHSKKYQ